MLGNLSHPISSKQSCLKLIQIVKHTDHLALSSSTLAAAAEIR